MEKTKSICVYCGSQPGADPIFMQTANQLGKEIADHGYGLVYGGGTNGLMGEVARSAKANGAHITGIIPEFLLKYEADTDAMSFIDDLVITPNMHERKAKMFEKADAFVTLPGGIGTLEEVIEIMTWAQLARHDKPIAFLNVVKDGTGYWDLLFNQFEAMKMAGFLHNTNRINLINQPSAKDVIGEIDQRIRQN